jgi:cell division cycle protein 37
MLTQDGLLRRIDTLLAELKARETEAKDPNTFIYQAMIASAGDPDDDEAPKPPEGVHSQEKEPIRYSQMMGSLIDQVKKEVDESKSDDWYKGYLKGVESHKKKVSDLQKDLAAELSKLEKEETRKITSEHIHDGFNSSYVAKDKPSTIPASPSTKKPPPSKPGKTVEVLNPAALKSLPNDDAGQTSGADADIDEDVDPLAEEKEDKDAEASPLGKKFARIPEGDYGACLKFIAAHRELLAEKETDGLLVMGFDSQMKGMESFARQCVHQALLLQYCRSLGPDGVQLFFKRYLSRDLLSRPD